MTEKYQAPPPHLAGPPPAPVPGPIPAPVPAPVAQHGGNKWSHSFWSCFSPASTCKKSN